MLRAEIPRSHARRWDAFFGPMRDLQGPDRVHWMRAFPSLEDQDDNGMLVTEEVPKELLELRVDLAGKALHAFIVREVIKSMYIERYKEECGVDGVFIRSLSELSDAAQPLLELGDYYYRHGLEVDVLEKIERRSGKTVQEHVSNTVGRSMSISINRYDCSGFLSNIKERVSLYEGMNSSKKKE